MSRNKPSVFYGAATALVTPFKEGKIDFEAYERLLERQIASGIDALVVAGTTGEASVMSPEEIRSLIEFTVKKADGVLPVIAGTGCNNTARAVELTKNADMAGANAFLVVTPYYNKATQKGLIENYSAVANCTKKPIIVYNVPTRTCVNITKNTYKELSKIENIVAVKEANADIVACAELISECGDDLDIYTGNDDEVLPVLAVGGIGVISVAANLVPGEIHKLCRSYLGGNTSEARRLYRKYLPLMRAMFCEVNPIPVKTALSMKGLCCEEFRLPLCMMSDENREQLANILNKYPI